MVNILIWSLMTIMIYFYMRFVIQKTKLTLINPILMSMILLIGLLLVSSTGYGVYKLATEWITFLLGPVVVMLAIPLYKNRQSLLRNFLPIMVGVVTSFFTSLLSVFVLVWFFKLDNDIMLSLLPKSITTPMAIEVSLMMGGIESLTIIFVILTGVIGASMAPFVLKICHIKDPLAQGIAIGSSSHGIGTSKAVDFGESVAASSGLAMGLSGISTVLMYSIISSILYGGII